MSNIIKKIKWFIRKPRRYRQLFAEVCRIEPCYIMEIGTWTGTRAMQMIQEAHKFRPLNELSYYGFDLFEEMAEETFKEEISKKPPSEKEVLAKLQKTGAGIHLFKGDTTKVLPRMVGELPKMDFIFIDGGHSIKTIKSDWENVQKLMHNTTIVIFDDYWRNRTDAGAKPVVDAINREQFEIKVLPVVDIFDTEWGRLDIQFARVKKQ